MQSVYLFLTKNYIYYHLPDYSSSESILELDGSKPSPIDSLPKFLSELSITKSTSVNIVLDQSFVSFYHFTLPPVNRRKLGKILEFELADTLLLNIEDYYYDYYFRSGRENLSTEVGVFTIKKDLLHDLIQVCKEHNLEVRWILSMYNLQDIKLRDQFKPFNQILVSFEDTLARMFVYKDGFLNSCSSSYRITEGEDESSKIQSWQHFLDNINQKIKAVSLKENNTFKVSLDESTSSFIKINELQELKLNGSAVDYAKFQESKCKKLVTPSLLNQPNRVNLFKSNLLIFQELKKHTGRLIATTVIFGFCIAIYIGSFIYKNIYNSIYYNQLEQLYQQSISKYLPKGTSKTNATYILNEQVNELKSLRKKNLRYSKRSYKISNLLNDVALIKKKVPSFHLDRFTFDLEKKDQPIRIQGNVSSMAQYEKLKDQLNEMFPPESHTIKYSQKSRGNDIVQFTVTIRLTEKQTR